MSTSADTASPYRVLARKYRPADFTALIGQEPMVRTLTNAFETDRIAQAWMLTGVRGVGKTTTARILARALNYKTDAVDRPSIDLSVPGIHCQAIMEGRHVDILEMDAASHTGIDDIKQIIDGVRYSPVSARYKVYIIDEVHMLSDKAFNALLKTLEEPPPHAKFIFATTEIRKVPITVLSRCQRFDLRRVDAAELTRHLAGIAGKEGISADASALAMIARAAEGSVRDALSILDQAIAHGRGTVDTETVKAMLGLADRSRIVDLFEQIMAGQIAEALAGFRALYDVGADPVVVLNDLAGFVHTVTRLRFVPGAALEDAALTPDERDRGLSFAQTLSVTALSRAWQMLLKGIPECEAAARPFAAGEMLLIRLAHASTMPTLDEALKALDDAPSAPSSSPVNNQPDRQGGGDGRGGSRASQPAQSAGLAHAVATSASPRVSDPEPAPSASPAMQLIEGSAPPRPVVLPEPAAPVSGPAIAGLSDIADLCEKNRDIMMKVQVRKYLRLVAVEPGRLSVNVTSEAPASLIGDLSRKLQDWTGQRWIVSVSRDEGGATLEEAETVKRDALLVDASQDPQVASILDMFPGARVIDVRLGGAAALDGGLDDGDDADVSGLDDLAEDPDLD